MRFHSTRKNILFLRHPVLLLAGALAALACHSPAGADSGKNRAHSQAGGNPFRCVTFIDIDQGLKNAIVRTRPVLARYSAPEPAAVREGWKIRENSRGADNYFTAASHLARLRGLPDGSNPFRQTDDRFGREFYLPRDTGWGNGRIDEKSGALTYDWNDKVRLNVLEGGNLFGTPQDDGMWFGTGANYRLSDRLDLSAGAYVSFGRGVYKKTGYGGGLQLRYLLNAPASR